MKKNKPLHFLLYLSIIFLPIFSCKKNDSKFQKHVFSDNLDDYRFVIRLLKQFAVATSPLVYDLNARKIIIRQSKEKIR